MLQSLSHAQASRRSLAKGLAWTFPAVTIAALAPHADRRAHFISTLVAVRHAADPEPLVAVGRWPGQVLTAPRGSQGFGYDPLMWIPDLDATVAELAAEVKNRHSHRARSAALLRQMLVDSWHLAG